MQTNVCSICGDPVLVHPGEEDGVCRDCFEANFKGGLVLERPTVVHLADILPVRRRELSTRALARWLQRGEGSG